MKPLHESFTEFINEGKSIKMFTEADIHNAASYKKSSDMVKEI